MKQLLLLAFCFCSISLFAQERKPLSVRPSRPLVVLPERLVTQDPDHIIPGRKTPKPGIYRLPQDGMPCLVPETDNIAAIPNGWKNPVGGSYKAPEGSIPNPGIREQKKDSTQQAFPNRRP
jgi:hypothetical protein